MMEELLKRIEVLEEWKRQREVQQIANPLDEASRNTVFSGGGNVISSGAGSSGLTQSVNLTGDVQVINVPKAYLGTTKFVGLDGVEREYPYIA